MVELLVIRLMDRFLERFIALVFVGLEGGQILCDFLVSSCQLQRQYDERDNRRPSHKQRELIDDGNLGDLP